MKTGWERLRPPPSPGRAEKCVEGDEMSDQVLGHGRAAIVYRSESRTGQPAARKIFIGSALAELVNLVLLGANNPYVWDPSAMQEALCRRRILAHLVSWWLPGKVRVAKALEFDWNSEHQTNEMSTELIDGRGACLHHAYSASREWEYQDLRENVMRPLQRHLIEAGFDGLAWQAGFANPVAASNFLLTHEANGEKTWVWIDLESGVPAVFPLSPVALVRFYLARAFKFGRPMFDDVDLRTLKAYVAKHETALIAALGEEAWSDLSREIAKLEEIKDSWRAMSRFERSLRARLAGRAITSEQAAWYRQHRMRWYGREISHVLSRVVRLASARIAVWLAPQRLRTFTENIVRFLALAKFRTNLARAYVCSRIDRWRGRRQLEAVEADALLNDLHDDEASLYITDFGIHIAIKPVVKGITWLLLPALYGAGAINEVVLVTGVVAGGAIGRSLYTLPRVAAALSRGAAAPWIALGVGFMPIIGNLAFPLQLLYVGSVNNTPIAKFLIYDYTALIGSIMPVWGCQDSFLEHWTNHLGDIVVKNRRPLSSSAP